MRTPRYSKVLVALLLIGIAASALPASAAERGSWRGPRPRLLVVIAVDQMRGDVPVRYAGYLRYGLKRLFDGGCWYADAHHDHGITVTAAGHATLSTGCTPGHTGIVGNDWFDRSTGKTAYCTGDDNEKYVGADSSEPESQSPRTLRRPALGDWLKSSSPASKVFSVSGKDRSAVLMGGLKPDGAFWYHDKSGRYVTSTYYGTALPKWLETFNASDRLSAAFRSGWNRTLLPDDYLISTEDAVSTENDCVHTTFPHVFDAGSTEDMSAFLKGVMQTPFGDEMTLDCAERLVVEEKLGTDSAPDILWVGLSAADLVGHAYGPLSQEVQDYYVRIDRRIGTFLDFLDRRVGRGEYAVALSSDHGVMPLPEDLARRGFPATRVLTNAFTEALSEATDAAGAELGLTKPLYRNSDYMGVYLDFEEATSRGITPADVRRRVATKLRSVSFVADAMTWDELSAASVPSDRQYLDMYRRSFAPDRSPDVMIRPKEYALVSWRSCGTSHGTPYRFDTHVPMLIYGAGVPAERRTDRVRTIDLAPSLAKLLRIPIPATVDGVSILSLARAAN